ncbi:MAG: hypothetical protein WKF43_00605 [Acidimicrobiales bacterium]
MFEIVAIDVTAGADVAFAHAHALLRCGTGEELGQDPDHASGYPSGSASGTADVSSPRAPLLPGDVTRSAAYGDGDGGRNSCQ